MLLKIVSGVSIRTLCQRSVLVLAIVFACFAHAADTSATAEPVTPTPLTPVASPAAEMVAPAIPSVVAPTSAAPSNVAPPVTTQSSIPAANLPVASAPVITAKPLNLVWGILFLMALVGAAWWLIRRSGGLQMHGGRGMKVVAALQVGPRERVVLIDLAGQQWLVGVAPGNVSLLQHFEQPVLQSAAGDDFASKIRAVLQQGGNR